MGELTHAEMERWHYQALSNPNYRLECILDTMREELMMNQPLLSQEPEPIVQRTTPRPSEVDEIRGEMNYIINKLNELRDKPKKKVKPSYKGFNV